MVNVRELQMNQSDIAEYISLFNRVFSSGNMTEDLFRWKNVDNPCGRSIITVAESSGRIIGARSLWASSLILDNRPALCYQPCDTMVEQSYRRSGVFTKLTVRALEMARNSGCELVYNFPNEKSYLGYLKLGWARVDRMGTLVIPIAPIASLASYLRRLLSIRSDSSRENVSEPDPEDSSVIYKRVTVRAASPVECVEVYELLRPLMSGFVLPERSLGTFLWRYKQRPDKDYWQVLFERDGAALGYAVLDVYSTDLVVCCLVELFTLPGLVGELLAALRAFVAHQGVQLLWTATLKSQLGLGIADWLRLRALTLRDLPGLVLKELAPTANASSMRWWVWPGMTDTA